MHAAWLFEALDVRGRYLCPLSPRRLLILLIGYPLYLLIQGIHWLGFLLDEVFFRKYRDVIIKEPLIITGIPRSGSTFVHRTLSRASNQFTTFQTWEAVLAPSITERRVIQFIARLDNRIESRPLHRLVDKIMDRLCRDMAHIHEVGLKTPEEDYLTLLPVGACFLMVLGFPASRSLWQLGRFQEMPDEQREVVLNYYKACLQKHMYWAGPEKRLLSKNAAFGSWLPDLRFLLPDARYIVCVRKPGEALSSQLSSIRGTLGALSTISAADTYSLEMQTVFAHVYRIILKEKQSFLVDHLAIINQPNLKEATYETLRASLKQLCFRIDNELEQVLRDADKESARYTSQHIHAPFPAKSGPDEFNSLVEDIYKDILEKPYMTRNER
jgi:hypothetical protein